MKYKIEGERDYYVIYRKRGFIKPWERVDILYADSTKIDLGDMTQLANKAVKFLEKVKKADEIVSKAR